MGKSLLRSRGVIEIGLTGGIGAGKSTVAEALTARGAVLIDADQIVHELQRPGDSVFDAMVERWGDRIVCSDGNLDRGAIAAIVFSDKSELDALNDIVHPAVAREIEARRSTLEHTDSVVVLDIPLLVRTDGEPLNDTYSDLAGIIVVDVSPSDAVRRLVEYRNFSESDARARIASQASREARLAVADFVIDNSGDLDMLDSQVDHAWTWACSLSTT